jgi:hypothetical protein
MPSTLILEGDFKKIRVLNNGRSCMTRLTIEIKDQNHPLYRNNPIGMKNIWIEKDSTIFLNANNRKFERRYFQMRMSVDQDLDLYALCMQDKTLQVWLYNCVD